MTKATEREKSSDECEEVVGASAPSTKEKEKDKKKTTSTGARTTRANATQQLKLPVSGRGRAGSNQASPVLPGRLPGPENGIPLSQIPFHCGPAVGVRRGLVDPMVAGLEDPCYDDVEEDDAEDVDRMIEREERQNRQLLREKRLAELKRHNLQLQSDISNARQEYAHDFVRNSEPEIRASANTSSSAVGGERFTRRLSQVGALTDIPTLATYQEGIPTLNDLRSRPNLQAQAERQIAQSGLWEQPSGSNPPQGNPVNSVSGGGSSLTSGRVAKAESGIQKPIVWPHTRLEGRVTNPSFDKLSLPLLLIGELGILEDRDISDCEKSARIRQLKRICTFASKNYEWEAIREFHGALLAGVERQGNWEVDTNELASQFIFTCARAFQARPQPPQPRFPPQYQPVQQFPYQQQPPGLNQGTRRRRTRTGHFFCSRFNRGQCGHAGVHNAVIAGKLRPAEHICALCWLERGELQEHPEIECPKAFQGKRNNPGGNGGNTGGAGGSVGALG